VKKPNHIAIVGCGFSGTSALIQLVKHYPVKHITIYEQTGDFGPGYAYRQNECQDYLINNTTDSMCLEPENKQAFIQWLRSSGNNTKVDSKGHLPRAMYGQFLNDMISFAKKIAKEKSIHIECISEEVINIVENENDTKVITRQNIRNSDRVLLTTGRCLDKDHYQKPPVNGAVYYPSHIETSFTKDKLPNNGIFYVLGASLSSYDVINHLYSENSGCRFKKINGELVYEPGHNKRKVILVSRTGRLKKIQSILPMKISRTNFTTRNIASCRNLDDLLDLVLLEANSHGVDLDIQAILDPYKDCKTTEEINERAASILKSDIALTKSGRNFLVDLFQDAQLDIWDGYSRRALSMPQENLYRKNYETAFLSYFAPCPIPTSEKLLALHKSGALEIRKGIQDVSLSRDGKTYQLTFPTHIEEAKYLINTTGSVVRRINQPELPELFKNLEKSGFLEQYRRDGVSMDGANIDLANFLLPGTKRIYMANMWLWGPAFFTSSTFLMSNIIKKILQNLYKN